MHPLLRLLPAVAVIVACTLAPAAAQTRSESRPVLTDSLAGRDSFDSYCAPCHGTTATGDGPVAPGLRSRPPDLTRLAMREGGTFPRERVREFVTGTGRPVPAHGSKGMPVWGPIFRSFESDARVRARIAGLVAYLESIQLPAQPR
jgi:mono/diheme cytochrome c family protein